MKIKILSSAMKTYWYSDRIGDELYVDYNIESVGNPFIYTENHHYIRSCDSVITELPESFSVKRGDDGIKWGKYIDWLNKTYGSEFDGNHWECYGIWENGFYCNDKSFGTEIHIDDMIKHIDYMETKDSITVKYENGKFIEVKEEFNMNTVEGRLAYARKHYPIGCTVIEVSGEKFKSKVKEIHTSVNNSIKLQFGAGLLYNNITGEWAEIIKEEVNMETQKLSRQGLKEIHGVACSAWKQTLEQYGSRNPLEDYIDLTQEEVNQMFGACTKDQLPIVSKYLKKDDLLDFDKISGSIQTPDGQQFIGKRVFGKFENKSFYLYNAYDWEIKEDDLGELCLIPTKKK